MYLEKIRGPCELDILSQGRVIAGLGIRFSKDEYEASGVPYKHRGERANEFLK